MMREAEEMLPTKSIKFSFVIIAKPHQSVLDVLSSLKLLLNTFDSEIDIQIIRGLCPSLQRNIGAQNAVNEFLVFLDNDSFLSDDYFQRLQEAIDLFPEALAIGGISKVYFKNKFQKSIKIVFSSFWE